MSNHSIYVVPHTHYDAIWVFTKNDYFYINIDMILRKVCSLMKKYKEFRFLIEQTYLLEKIEKTDKNLFKEIEKLIKEDRIEIADGEYLMADTMLPLGETLVREILIGKKYVKEKFNKNVEVMWQADSFGLNAQLPQIYRKCGYSYVAFRRGAFNNKPSEFIWEGLDGTRIIAHTMPLGYRAGLDVRKWKENFEKLKLHAATHLILMPAGSGVTLPQENIVSSVKEWNKSHESKMKISTPIEFFKELEKFSNNLPIRKGEMYSGKYSEIFPDVASSRIWVKIGLRECENLLLTLEKLLTISNIIKSYSIDITDLWKKLLFIAFHDGVPGTGIDSAYEEIRKYINDIKSKAKVLLKESIKRILCNGDFEADIVVFNPLSWNVKNWVEVEVKFNKGVIKNISSLECEEGNVEIEIIEMDLYNDNSIKRAVIGFIADVPAMGYKLYKVSEKKINGKNFEVNNSIINNNFFKLKFNKDIGVVDVEIDGRIIKANEIVIDEEHGDLYNHKQLIDVPIKTETGEGIKYGSFRVDNFKLYGSNIRKVIEFETNYYSLRWPYRLTDILKPIIWRYKNIIIKKKIIVYRDIPRIDFITSIENKHPRIRIRTRFKTDIDSKDCVCDTQFGCVNRKTNLYYEKADGWKEKPSGVYPALRWICYSDGKVGITVLNKGTPEFEVRDRDVYLTLLRSVDTVTADGKAGPIVPVPDARELKRYTFKYAMLFHKKDWRDIKSFLHGHEFNTELVAFQINRKMYKSKETFFSVKPDNIVVVSVKKGENGNGVVFRMYEAIGKESDVEMCIFKEIKNIKFLNIIEDKEEDKVFKVYKNKIRFKIKPFEIVTLKIELRDTKHLPEKH